MTTSDKKSRPFPWRCHRCRQAEVFPAIIPYQASVRHEDVIHLIELPALEVPRCKACGELTFDAEADEQIRDALRTQLRLLKKEEIVSNRNKIGLSTGQLADRLGVSEQTVFEWEDGESIQSRAMDNLLRLFFALPEVRAVLIGKQQDPQLGMLVG